MQNIYNPNSDLFLGSLSPGRHMSSCQHFVCAEYEACSGLLTVRDVTNGGHKPRPLKTAHIFSFAYGGFGKQKES